MFADFYLLDVVCLLNDLNCIILVQLESNLFIYIINKFVN